MKNHVNPVKFGLWRVVAVLGLLLTGLCAWGGWAALQPDDTFILPTAQEVRWEQVRFGTKRVLYTYEGGRGEQRTWVQQQTQGGSWRRSAFMEDCEGRCSDESTRVYVRRLVFGLMRDVAMIDQSGDGPYKVRIVFKRCVRLPTMGCWPY